MKFRDYEVECEGLGDDQPVDVGASVKDEFASKAAAIESLDRQIRRVTLPASFAREWITFLAEWRAFRDDATGWYSSRRAQAREKMNALGKRLEELRRAFAKLMVPPSSAPAAIARPRPPYPELPKPNPTGGSIPVGPSGESWGPVVLVVGGIAGVLWLASRENA